MKKKFNLDGPDGFRHYWRDLRKEPLYFSKTNFGGGSAMVWGAFNKFAKFDLQFTSSRMNSADYIQVLKYSLLQFLNENREAPYARQCKNPHQAHDKNIFARKLSGVVGVASMFTGLKSD